MNLTLALALIALHPPPGLTVRVEADPKAVYYAKCHIRTFHATMSDVNFGMQGFVNIYIIDSHGPFFDRIPSPNAQCVFGKLKGRGPVTLHIVKNGDHAVTVTGPNEWVRLNVW